MVIGAFCKLDVLLLLAAIQLLLRALLTPQTRLLRGELVFCIFLFSLSSFILFTFFLFKKIYINKTIFQKITSISVVLSRGAEVSSANGILSASSPVVPFVSSICAPVSTRLINIQNNFSCKLVSR